MIRMFELIGCVWKVQDGGEGINGKEDLLKITSQDRLLQLDAGLGVGERREGWPSKCISLGLLSCPSNSIPV